MEESEFVVFRSDIPDMTVSFSKIAGRDEDGKKIIWPKRTFEDYELRLKKDSDYVYKGMDFKENVFIDFMRKHVGNHENGGDSFWEQSIEERVFLKTGQFYGRRPTQGMGDDDEEAMAYLLKASKKIAPNQIAAIHERINLLYDRFGIVNFPRPNETWKLNRLRNWITMFLFNLTDLGLMPEEEENNDSTEGQGNTG